MIEWFGKKWKLSNFVGKYNIEDMSKNKDNLTEGNDPRHIQGDKISELGVEQTEIDSIKNLLLSNHNLILTGAPGTGKTYLAKQIAESIGANWELVQFHPSYDYSDFVEGLRPVKNKEQLGFERKDGVFKEFCKNAIKEFPKIDIDVSTLFSSTYNELAREIRTGDSSPFDTELRKAYVTEDGRIAFRSVDGRKLNDEKHGVSKATLLKLYEKIAENIVDFDSEDKISRDKCDILNGKQVDTTAPLLLKELYKRTKKELKQLSHCSKSVLIIDEINRGEVSKIFGELFYSIDPGYRGEKGIVFTQYQNLINKDDVFYKGFFVPENVYIIGTMNDIDRSVESMDFAMRRRFAWKEITAKSSQSILDDDNAWGNNGKPSQEIIEEIKIRMDNLNAAIVDKYDSENLSSKVKIGLSKAFQIGASYFLKYNQYNNFDELWNYHLEGLLYEYLRGSTNIDMKIERLKAAYNDITAH